MLDSIKDLGYKYATLFGATIGLSDMIVPTTKKDLVGKANIEQQKILDQYRQGHITQEERYNRVIEVWTQTNDLLTDELMGELRKNQNGFNPLFLMADSGARGSVWVISARTSSSMRKTAIPSMVFGVEPSRTVMKSSKVLRTAS